MVRFRISQLAGRVGVPATTLRYYEARGLLPAQRSAGGYRTYDDRDAERVRFITTAKGLGLPLSRIRELLDVWHGGPCRDVRDRLLPLVADRITDLDRRVRDLHDHRRHLVEARDRLHAMPARDAPCAPDCTVLVGQQRPGTDGEAAAGSAGPIACSLAAGDHAARLARWGAALSGTVPWQLDDGTVRAEIPLGRVAEIAALVADEVACCPFLGFTIGVTREGARLDATAPAEARSSLHELFSAGRTGPRP